MEIDHTYDIWYQYTESNNKYCCLWCGNSVGLGPNDKYCKSCFDVSKTISIENGICTTHILHLSGMNASGHYDKFYMLTNNVNMDLKNFNINGVKNVSIDNTSMKISNQYGVITLTKILITPTILTNIRNHTLVLHFLNKSKSGKSKDVKKIGFYESCKYLSDFFY